MNQLSKMHGEEVARDADLSFAPVADDTAVAPVPAKSRNRLVLMLSVPLILAAIGLFFWLTGGKVVETDNAYVKQDVTAISTQVNGPVAAVYVDENQHVKAGDLLYRVDPAPYQAAVAAAEAQLAAARLATSQLVVQADGTGADIVGARANLAIQQRALSRQSALLARGFTTKSRYDDALSEVQKAQTQLADARAKSNNASAAIAPGGNQPAIAAAIAALQKARLDLAHTSIRAPTDGVVAKSDRLLVGQSAITGVAMLSLVGDRGAWVDANFKEGDLARMAVGQRAKVRFDAYPDLEVDGRVASIGAGTGSEFSVLPAQNANGNWVKVTQRVPVRIAFAQKPPRQMITGLSAHVEVQLDGAK
jgi:membrane fusion protein (multidrug efflux system)